jgi:uncharacterized membrane protein YfcA
MIASLSIAIALPIVCGAVAGFGFGLTAAGGSVLAVPLLIYVLHMPPHKAVCMSMLTICVLAAIATALRWRENQIDVRAGLTIGIAGIFAAPFGAWINQHISEASLIMSFALLMVIVAARMFYSARQDSVRRTALSAISSGARLPLVAAIGTTTGLVAGLLGVGGGFIIVPGLVLLKGDDIHKAIATAFLAIAMISTSATLSHVVLGQRVPPAATANFVTAAIAGLFGGMYASNHINKTRLQIVFALTIFAAALVIIVRTAS